MEEDLETLINLLLKSRMRKYFEYLEENIDIGWDNLEERFKEQISIDGNLGRYPEERLECLPLLKTHYNSIMIVRYWKEL